MSLCKIIREEDQHTWVTLLEYLKQPQLIEWDNFVKDTKMIADQNSRSNPFVADEKTGSKVDDLLFYDLRFKTLLPEYMLWDMGVPPRPRHSTPYWA